MEVSALAHTGVMPGLKGPSPLLRLQSDEKLIALTRSGHHAAFEAICGRYQSRLLAFCRHMLASREDAEDVLQEVFAAAFNAVLADDRPINVRPWLYRIARNRSLNHLRRATATGVDSMDVHFAEHGLSTSDKVLRRESFRELIADVHDLPETQRTALLLREIDALSYEQIAEAMETTVPSVKSLLVRARISLAEAAEARKLSCEEVREELGEVAEGLTKLSTARAPPRARVRSLRVLQEAAQGEQPRARDDHARRPAAARQEGPARQARHNRIRGRRPRRRRRERDGGCGRRGAAAAAGGSSVAGGLMTAGAGALATKAAAGLAAAAIVTAGAVAADHAAVSHHHSHPRALREHAHATRLPSRWWSASTGSRSPPARSTTSPRSHAAKQAAKAVAAAAPATTPTPAPQPVPATTPTVTPAEPPAAAPAPSSAPSGTQVTEVTSQTTELPPEATSPPPATTTPTTPTTPPPEPPVVAEPVPVPEAPPPPSSPAEPAPGAGGTEAPTP